MHVRLIVTEETVEALKSFLQVPYSLGEKKFKKQFPKVDIKYLPILQVNYEYFSNLHDSLLFDKDRNND